MKTMLDMLRERLPEGLEITKIKNRANSSQIQLRFRYQGIETCGTLQKACAPGCAEQNCDFAICSAMMSIALRMGNRSMADCWHEKLHPKERIRSGQTVHVVRNQSLHQHLVGQSFFRDNCRMCCIAAHEDAILILQYGGDGQPANYVVCHHPELNHDTLIWGAGDYFTIRNYENCGRSNPMSDALTDAMERLMGSTLLEFHYDPIENEPDNQSVYVIVRGKLESDDLKEIEDSISSYLEATGEYGFEQLVENVMHAHSSVSFRIIRPKHTFHI